MSTIRNVANYEAWYHTPRGAWIGDREFSLMMSLLQPVHGATLLDVGCGTGYFSRRFATAGLRVAGIDPDPAAIAFARSRSADCEYIQGSATNLPFDDSTFDYCAAITSLCFISNVAQAVQEMWRVSRRGMVLGLLNRLSLLYRQKHGQGSYAGARWDTASEVNRWIATLNNGLVPRLAYAVFLPSGGKIARVIEARLPQSLPFGSFLAVALEK